MDLPATQICDDYDFTPTQKISHSTLKEIAQEEVEIGILRVGSTTYPIKRGINQIGRHPSCGIILNDQTVSKKHAEIEANIGETSAWICDLNSSNKTKLNNSVLRPGRCYELKDGNVLEFGMVQATYKAHRSMDESLILDTPAPNRQRKQQIVIPGTPDSSLNNSSTLGGNSSIIPATQADNKESIFRYPTLPLRISTSSTRKSGVQDSSFDNSIGDARSSLSDEKKNVDEKNISIHDMETQESCEFNSVRNADIHDDETQKISSRKIKSPTKEVRAKETDIHDMETQREEEVQGKVTDIHDVETQHEEEVEGKVTDIHDVETQHDVDIHNAKTPEKVGIQDVVTQNNNTHSIEKSEKAEYTNEKNLTIEEKSGVTDDEVRRKIEVNGGASCSADANKLEEKTEDMESTQESLPGSQEYLQLSLTTNFEDEPLRLDRSRNLLGSQNLVDFIDHDGPSDEIKSKSSAELKATRNNSDNSVNGKSTDDENIFEAATQVNKPDENAFQGVTQRVKYSFKASLIVDDSDDTDNECVFQRYSRNVSQSTEKASKSQESDSESITDEEGHFMELAPNKRKATSSSSEKRQNVSKEGKNDSGSSKDSEDLFNMLTQPAKPKSKDSSIEQGIAGNDDVDSDTPTQMIDVGGVENNLKINENIAIKETDDDVAPTQVLPTELNIMNSGRSSSLGKSKIGSDEEDITEMEDNTATQILSGAEKTFEPVRDESPCLLVPNEVEEYSVENIDYETAPTQLISEIETKKSASSTLGSKKTTPKKRSRASKKVNLDDTIEKRLTEMFDDVNERHLEEQPRMSTQVLETVLESQCGEKLPTRNQKTNMEGELSTNSVPRKSTRGRKSKSALVSSPSNSVSKNSQELHLTNLNTDSDSRSSQFTNVNTDSDSRSSQFTIVNTDSDSRSSQNYFSTLTSGRKRNVIVDSQDSADPVELLPNQQTEEQTSINAINAVSDKNSNICVTPLKSTPKGSSTPRSRPEVTSTPTSSRKNKTTEAKAAITEETLVDKNESNKSLINVNNQIASPSTNGEQLPKVSKVLEDDDEDILAGLPEVRISGTLSNPASPTSSTTSDYRINVNNNRSKQVSVMIAPKKKRAPRKTTRKSFARGNVEDIEPYHTVSKPNSSIILGSLSNSFSSNLDVDKATVQENDDGKINKKTRSAVRKTTGSTRRTKETDYVPQPKSNISIESQKEARLSPSIQRNGRTRSSRKENVDCSSVFQVGKDAPVEKAAAEPVKTNILNMQRTRKRSLSMTDAFESSNAKKRKEDANKGEPVVSKGRKRRTIAARRQSANILDYVTKRNSPANTYDSSDMKLISDKINMCKEAVVNVVWLSPCASSGSMSPSTPIEWIAESNGSNKTTQSQRTNITSSQIDANPSIKEIEKTVQKMTTRRGASQAAIGSKIEQQAVELNSEIGEESQEVEMILNGSLREQTTNSNVESKEDIRGSRKGDKGRKTKKRANTNVEVDVDITENSASSEPDNVPFEVPTSKAKRAKVSRTVSNITNNAINESATRSGRNSRQSSRSTRSQKSTVDSSVDENADSTISQTRIDNTTIKTNNSRAKRQRKARNVESDKDAEDTTSSEMNSSVETASTVSTPTRIRRSIYSSFSSSSPLKTKHKILFTGISSNEYSKLLTKLGASQVEDPAKCTVLVTDKVRRTVKFLCALAQSIPIVSVDWLDASEKAGCFVDLEDYILKDPAAETKFGFKLVESLEKSKERKLLEGYTIVLTPNIVAPPLPELKSIIVSCGGKALVRPPPSWPQKAAIVSREEDLANAKKFLAKAPKTVTVQSTEFILTGILRQVLDFTEFKLN